MQEKVFVVTYPDGKAVEYLESDLMPGFDECYHGESDD